MSAAAGDITDDDILAEGTRLATAAATAGIRLRLLGGVAVAIRCPSASHPSLARGYGDIDAVSRGGDRRKLGSFLEAEGYRGLEQLNAVHGKARLFYVDPLRSRRLDVFMDHFEMCHYVDLRRRVELPGLTLPLADLLLTKLQVVQTTDKDLRDITALLSDHDLTTDDEGVNITYLTDLTGSDWGLCQTVRVVTERAQRFATEHDFASAAERAGRLLRAIERAPKSRKWSMRARVGERVRWYKLPEEPDFN